MKNILTTLKGKEITLADGKVYNLSGINLNVLADLEEELDCSLSEMMDKLNNRVASSLRSLLYVLLKKNHPNLTRDRIGELVTMDNMGDISSVIGDVLTAAQAVGE